MSRLLVVFGERDTLMSRFDSDISSRDSVISFLNSAIRNKLQKVYVGYKQLLPIEILIPFWQGLLGKQAVQLIYFLVCDGLVPAQHHSACFTSRFSKEELFHRLQTISAINGYYSRWPLDWAFRVENMHQNQISSWEMRLHSLKLKLTFEAFGTQTSVTCLLAN